MKFPNRETVELVRMDDVQAPPIGTQGTIEGVDDTASIMARWDNGSHLHVVYGEDVPQQGGGACPTAGKYGIRRKLR